MDESKRAGYVLASVAVADPAPVRRQVQGLVVPGRRRLHMNHEHVRHRRLIVSTLVATPIEATVYDAARRYQTDLAARAACLAALVEDLADAGGDTVMVIEQDDSLVRSDRHELYRLARSSGITDLVEYHHRRPHEELLLALPDVVAWCWVRSGDWRRRVAPILGDVRHVGS